MNEPDAHTTFVILHVHVLYMYAYSVHVCCVYVSCVCVCVRVCVRVCVWEGRGASRKRVIDIYTDSVGITVRV